MPGFLPDTSLIVASVCSWHEHHSAAAREIDSRLARGERMAVAAPALIEAYAVLTRLPTPHRLSPRDAYALIAANFIEGRKIVSLDGAGTKALLAKLAREGIAGGQSYDAVVATCAGRAGAAVVLTFNRSHFEAFATKALRIVIPGTGP